MRTDARSLFAYDAEYVALAEALAVRLVTNEGRVLAVSITAFADGR